MAEGFQEAKIKVHIEHDRRRPTGTWLSDFLDEFSSDSIITGAESGSERAGARCWFSRANSQ
jgi:hypothetical protein